jgi:hypothetical protein
MQLCVMPLLLSQVKVALASQWSEVVSVHAPQLAAAPPTEKVAPVHATQQPAAVVPA